jgi:hypothetical protein
MEEWSGSTVQIQLTRCRGESDGEKLDDGGIIESRRGHGKDRRWVGQAKEDRQTSISQFIKGISVGRVFPQACNCKRYKSHCRKV